MRPLFTIHAGEFLAAAYIEQHFRKVNVWVPTRDAGIDLLVSKRRNRQAVALQVKYSRDFLVTHKGPELQRGLRACGWWTLNRDKLRMSPADYWVFVLQGFANRSVDYVIVRPKELLGRLDRIHGRQKVIQMYLWVTEGAKCWEARGLKHNDELLISLGEFTDPSRDFSKWLNAWSPISRLNR